MPPVPTATPKNAAQLAEAVAGARAPGVAAVAEVIGPSISVTTVPTRSASLLICSP